MQAPPCGSRFAEQAFPPPDQFSPCQCSRRRIPDDARAQALIYPQIDIKKSGKTHLIEDAIKTPRIAMVWPSEQYQLPHSGHQRLADSLIFNRRREDVDHRVRRSIQLKNSDQRFGIIQRRGQGKRLLENDARAVSCELPLGLIPNSACEQNRSPISEWLASGSIKATLSCAQSTTGSFATTMGS